MFMEKIHTNCHQGRQIKDGMLEGRKKSFFLFDYTLHILVSSMEYGRQLQIAELSSTDKQRRPH
jgi:hypothetical protein